MSYNALNRTHHGVKALAVFVLIAGSLLWLTGTFSGGKATASATRQAAAPDDAPGDACCPADKPAERQDVEASLDPAQIEKARCEHGIAQVACDECRYELGVVKLDPSVSRSLIRTVKAEQAQAVRRLQLTGEVQFDQARRVEILPICPGKVVAVHARLGQHVAEGEVLAIIRSSEFGEAKAAYLEALATAEVAAREKQRQAAVSTALEHMLAALDAAPTAEAPGGAPLGEWRSRLVGAIVRRQNARSVVERRKPLVAQGITSQADYEAAQRELQTAEADYAALVEEVQLNLNVDRLKAENAARLAEAKLAAAEQRLHLFGLDDTAITAIPGRRQDCTFAELEVRAPRAGTITAQDIAEGRLVDATRSLFTVADLSNLWVWCDLYERDLAGLHDCLARGQAPRVAVKVQAFDEAFPGVIDLVGSTVDETTRTIKVRVQLPNPAGRLKPGMFASIEVDLPAGGMVFLVPRSAVLSDEGQSFAFQHWKDDLWLRRNVQVGKAQADKVEVLAGLDPDATVVSNGAFLLKSDVLKAKMGAGCAD